MEETHPPRPVRTWRPMLLWTAALLAVLGLVWIVWTAVAPEAEAETELDRTRTVVFDYVARGYDPYFPRKEGLSIAEAVERLGGPAQALARLRNYLRTPDRLAPHKLAALWLLSGCGAPAARDLAEALSSPDAIFRDSARLAIALMGSAAREAIPALIAEFKGPDLQRRAQAAGTLGTIGPEAREALAPLLSAVDDTNSKVRWVAAEAVCCIAPESGEVLEAVARMLKDPDLQGRRYLVQVLFHLPAKDAVPMLVKALEDADDLVREHAAVCLWHFGPAAREAIPALEKAAKDESWGVRGAAAGALKKIGGEQPPK